MPEVYSDVIQFRGTHYNFGYFQGQSLRHSLILANRKKQWGPKKDRHFIIDVTTYKRTIRQFAPRIWEEINGLADALEMDLETVVQLFGGYYLEYVKSGCSVFADAGYMVRNYDSHPRSYEGRYLFYQPSDEGYAVIGPSMQITGRIDGMNEKGLVMAYNFTHRKQSEDGFLCNMIGRLILETCADVSEAIALLKDIPHRHSFSYILLDRGGLPYVVEASPREVAVRQTQACTNHFHTLDAENRYRQDESRRREKTIREQQRYASNPYQAFKVMNDPSYDIFSFKFDAAAGTLHTAAYLPQELKAWFAMGPGRKPVIFDFEAWLNGTDTRITRILGELDYPGVFANMA